MPVRVGERLDGHDAIADDGEREDGDGLAVGGDDDPGCAVDQHRTGPPRARPERQGVVGHGVCAAQDVRRVHLSAVRAQHDVGIEQVDEAGDVAVRPAAK